jgi:4-amino-4-deoxy-L-arabinose transferase-like glycosyltransferase
LHGLVRNVSFFLIFLPVAILLHWCLNSDILWGSDNHRYVLCVYQRSNNINCAPGSKDKDVLTVG